VIGKTRFLLKDALARASGSSGLIGLYILDDKNKYCGKMEISMF
jgi:hypothetical protein